MDNELVDGGMFSNVELKCRFAILNSLAGDDDSHKSIISAFMYKCELNEAAGQPTLIETYVVKGDKIEIRRTGEETEFVEIKNYKNARSNRNMRFQR